MSNIKNNIHNDTDVKERECYWDNIKGVLIFLVVFAHCLYNLCDKDINAEIVQTIYYFHMPAFIFVSGFFSKSKKSRSKQAIIKLIIAYVLMMIPFIIRSMMLETEVNLLTPQYSAWYLLALIVWRLLTPHIVNDKIDLYIAIVFSVLVGYFPDISGEGALAIYKVVVYWPFFIGGYILPNDFVTRIKNKAYIYRFGLALGLLAMALCVIYISNTFFGATMHNLLPSKYCNSGMNEPIVRILILVIATLFIMVLMLLSVEKRIPGVTKIGRNTLLIYMAHRMLTIFYYENAFIISMRARYQILGAIVLTLMILTVFGNDKISTWFNSFLNNCTKVISNNKVEENKELLPYKISVIMIVIVCFVVPVIYQLLRM